MKLKTRKISEGLYLPWSFYATLKTDCRFALGLILRTFFVSLRFSFKNRNQEVNIFLLRT